MKAYYYACISFIDYQVGRLLTVLEETGQLDNTLILFSSDHSDSWAIMAALASAACSTRLPAYRSGAPAGRFAQGQGMRHAHQPGG